MKSTRTFKRAAFTLVELLVVIAIIGILIALLLPAVQAAREAGRRTQCKNNLKQIGLGMMTHNDTQKHLPSSGWGYKWTGDPSKGFGPEQPGGWMYNLLPFIEQKGVHDMAKGATNKYDVLATMKSSVIATYNCPSRRDGLASVVRDPAQMEQEYNADQPTQDKSGQARGDYAGNAGTFQKVTSGGDSCPPVPQNSDTIAGFSAKAYFADPSKCAWWSPEVNGVTFAGSFITLKKIPDGTTKTYFAGEKALQPRFYLGGGPTDNGPPFQGHDWDTLRWGGKDAKVDTKTMPTNSDLAPLRDKDDTDQNYGRINFGAAHPSTCMFVMCDGSVQEVSYSIDATVHWRYSNRRDGIYVDSP